MPGEEGSITADVHVAKVPAGFDSAGLTKVRLTIWSGPDFKTPTIMRGKLYASEGKARDDAAAMLGALELLGVPADLVDFTGSAIEPKSREALLHEVRAGEEPPRVD